MEAILVTVLFLAVLGFIVHLIVTYIPMAAPFKEVIIVGVVILLALWLLAVLFGGASLPTLPRFSRG